MKNKKILFIHHGQIIGGAPRSLKNTIIGLEKEGFENIKVLFAYADLKSFFQEGTNIKVGNIYANRMIFGRVLVGLSSIFNIRAFIYFILEFISFPYTVYKQYQDIKKEKVDIIHLNSSILFSVALASRLANIKLVWHVREVVIGGKFSLKKRFTGWLIRKLADEVICISEVEAKALGHDTFNNVHVIYNFVDFSSFNSDNININEEKKKYNIDNDKKIAISLGGVSFRKGTVEIIQTARMMYDVLFLIAGSCPIRNEYSYLQWIFIKSIHSIEDSFKKFGLKNIYSYYYEQRAEWLYFESNLKNAGYALDVSNPYM